MGQCVRAQSNPQFIFTYLFLENAQFSLVQNLFARFVLSDLPYGLLSYGCTTAWWANVLNTAVYLWTMALRSIIVYYLWMFFGTHVSYLVILSNCRIPLYGIYLSSLCFASHLPSIAIYNKPFQQIDVEQYSTSIFRSSENLKSSILILNYWVTWQISVYCIFLIFSYRVRSERNWTLPRRSDVEGIIPHPFGLIMRFKHL